MKRNKEDLKNYHKIFNQNKLGIRFSPRERALLENWMRRDGWENMSGFIKYRLFGYEPDLKVRHQVEEGRTEDIVNLLRNEIKELARLYTYVSDRYAKDMNVLYEEESVDIKKWIASTNQWHATLAKRTYEMMDLYILIVKHLGLENQLVPPFEDTDETKIGEMTNEERERIAESLRQELLLFGRDINN